MYAYYAYEKRSEEKNTSPMCFYHCKEDMDAEMTEWGRRLDHFACWSQNVKFLGRS